MKTLYNNVTKYSLNQLLFSVSTQPPLHIPISFNLLSPISTPEALCQIVLRTQLWNLIETILVSLLGIEPVTICLWEAESDSDELSGRQVYLNFTLTVLILVWLLSGLKEKGHAVPKLYEIENSVSSWSDYLRPHFHPRSINLVQEYQHNSTTHPFDAFPQGQAVWSSPRFHEEFTDRIRLYLEETDNLQVWR